ncbi:F0F1 ATP synthase subunit A [Maribellus sp. YY47]|uniref:F0F1 ATP synthase subunit A n=1 Tax=Maribellus sp. YY47 TaxID=2929486 RepID=UPI0020008726|nr:F0F1 ATP synthase subunit A [Maribellus sp. YY47]MCK3683728.1 F0F1 ATP synthase subunit A [Maribellus sp. YY47]
MLKLSKSYVITVAFLFFSIGTLFAQHTNEENHAGASESHAAESHQEEFSAGDFVIDHVSDSYDWHITSWGETHISIPLPVILYSKHPELHDGKAFHVFMSSKFHHGHDAYNGFKISTSEEFKGKIVELDAHGHELEKPIDLSITKAVAGVFVSVILLFWLLLATARSAKRNKGKAPSGVQNLLEPIILFIRDEVAKPAIGEHKYEKFMPFLLSLFFFILINNFMGLIPIIPFGANVTGNISVTMVLALFTFAITTINGNKHYWKEIYWPDVPVWLKFPLFPLMQVVEFSGMLTKPFVLMVRLFANMLAGHLIVMVFVSLIFVFGGLFGPAVGLGASPVSIAFSVFILLLDVLVSFIQAYVFTLLSALYFGMATSDHH